MNDPIAELPDWARELLADAPVARLGLLDDDHSPRVLPVTFAVAEGRVWTAVDSKPKRDPRREPARVRYLRRRPAVAFTVDRYADDWQRLAWVQLLGRASLHDPERQRAPLDALLDKYEPYRHDPPPGPLIAIEPARALSWSAAPDQPR